MRFALMRMREKGVCAQKWVGADEEIAWISVFSWEWEWGLGECRVGG